MDTKKAKRALIRRYVIAAVKCGWPIPVTERLILMVIQEGGIQCDAMGLRRELSYLVHRKSIILNQPEEGSWSAELQGQF